MTGCTCNEPANKVDNKTVTLSIVVEFELDGATIADIIEISKDAVDQLTGYGYVRVAKLKVPSTEMDLT